MTKDMNFIDGLLGQMTLQEKIGQLNLVTPGGETLTGTVVNTDVAEKIRTGRIGGIFGVKSAEAVRVFQDLAQETRLKIPLMFAEVETSGLRSPVMSASQKGSPHTLTPTDPSPEATPSARLLPLS